MYRQTGKLGEGYDNMDVMLLTQSMICTIYVVTVYVVYSSMMCIRGECTRTRTGRECNEYGGTDA